jgi:predicted  nucleic acid-binding Zn-ribbon protein
MMTNKQIKSLVKNVEELNEEVSALVDCIIELNETLEKQNDWLAELAGILSGEDEELEKEREEWKEHINPVNALSGRPHKGDRRKYHGSHKP